MKKYFIYKNIDKNKNKNYIISFYDGMHETGTKVVNKTVVLRMQ